MREDARRLRLAKQPFAQTVTLARVRQIIETNGFDGDGATDSRVLRTVHDAHGAAPQLAQNPESTDLLHAVRLL